MRRSLRRALLLGALAALLLALIPSGAGAQDAAPPRPRIFKGGASTTALQVRFDRRTGGLLPLPDVLRFALLQGSTTYESSDVAAEAAIFFPGNGVISGPGLVCGTFGGSFPAEFAPVLDVCSRFSFPLFVRADETQPDASTLGSTEIGRPGDALFAHAASAVAHSAADSSTSDVVTGDLDLQLLGLVQVLHLDSATSRTRQFIDESGNLVVEAEVTVSGLSLGGGIVPGVSVLEIGSIAARSRSVDDPGDDEPGTTEASVDVAGATVAGVPVQITDQGLLLGDPSAPAAPLTGALRALAQSLLQGLGVEVSVVGATEEVDEAGFTTGSATALRLHFGLDLREQLVALGLPDLADVYDIDLLIASAGTRAFATDVSLEPATARPSGGTGGATGSGDSSSRVTPGTPAATPGATPAAPSAPGTPEETPVDTIRDLLPGRIELLYLAFTLAALGLAVAPGLSVPARLPGVRRGSP